MSLCSEPLRGGALHSLLILCSVSTMAVLQSLQAQGSAQSLLSPKVLHRKG